MIYIITGVAKVGKTLISEKIKERFNKSIFSTDYIMMMLHYGNEDLDLDIHASDSTVASKLEPYVYGLIQTMVQNDNEYVIEGVHFNTDFSRRLKDEFGDKIRITYLGYKDVSVEDKVDEIYRFKNTMDNPWIFTLPGVKVEETVEYLINESERIYQECLDRDLEYYEVYDIVEQLEDIIEKVMRE